MKKEYFKIGAMPAILWGEGQREVIVAVHGRASSKEDAPIEILAEEAAKRHMQTLSVDLPQHGERQQEDIICKAEICERELRKVFKLAKTLWRDMSLFGNSMGAYYAMLAAGEVKLRKAMFLSPVTDMENIVDGMMRSFSVSTEELAEKKIVETPIGQTLYWDDYQYILAHPVASWKTQTDILCGMKDELCGYDTIKDFAKKNRCRLTVSEDSEHYFHTAEDMRIYRSWLSKALDGDAFNS